jgi:ABC-type multidrug transport system fused ATPase/permease subunit
MDPISAKKEQNNSFLSSIITLGLVGGAASFIRTVMLNQAKDNVAASLRRETFASLMIQRDLDWFQMDDSDEDESSVGEQARSKEEVKQNAKSIVPINSMTPAKIGVIMKDDVDTAAHTITATLANLLRSTSSCVFGTYHMLSLNPELVGISLLVAPVVGTLAFMTRKYLKKVLAIQQKAALNAASFLEERLGHIMMVKMSHREHDEIASYGQIQEEYVELGKKSAFANGLSMGSMFTLSTSALCGILLAGGKAVEAKRMTHGQLLSFGSYSFMLALGSAGIAKAIGEYMKGIQCAIRLYTLAHPVDAEAGASVDSAIPSPSGEENDFSFYPSEVHQIIFENVSFAYKARPSSFALQNISMSISRGEVVAIVGKNGAGKSSLASLLAGLYSPSSGNIYVAPVDSDSKKIDYINGLDRKNQTSLVQVVPQNPAIFNNSIFENIRYSRPDATHEEISKAMTAANCDEFVSRLEENLHFQVGRNGSKLSGGQRSRIGLARALLTDPRFLVLDEPASSLDSEGESAILDAIQACRAANRALFVITHRAKTLSLADRVVVLKEGKIVQAGNLSELKADKNGELFNLMPDLGTF